MVRGRATASLMIQNLRIPAEPREWCFAEPLQGKIAQNPLDRTAATTVATATFTVAITDIPTIMTEHLRENLGPNLALVAVMIALLMAACVTTRKGSSPRHSAMSPMWNARFGAAIK